MKASIFAFAQSVDLVRHQKTVFLVCGRLGGSLKQRTPLSRRVQEDLLVRKLQNTWGVTLQALSHVPLHSDCGRPTERCDASLWRMTDLFGTMLERSACKASQIIWDGRQARFGAEDKNLACGLIVNGEPRVHQLLSKAMYGYLLIRKMEGDGRLSISTLLNSVLDEGYDLENKSTTSTWTQETTARRIFTYLVACLNTIALTFHSLD